MRDKSKFKIAVVGIGGVGGYVGGKLAARFADSEDVEIILAARGKNEEAIRADGLKLITTKGEELIRPELAAAAEIDEADLILLCTKGYDLEETVSELKRGINGRTAVLPLLNGVDHTEKLARLLPHTEIWQGCIYIVSKLVEPGVVQESGNVCLIYFGNEKEKNEKSELVETIFSQAGIDAHLVVDITAKAWEKFVFISSLAAATSYLNTGIREILDKEESLKLLYDLLEEVKLVAKAKKIDISETAVQQKFDKLSELPFEATSSLHRDFSQGNKTELQSLVGYVVAQADDLGVPVPVYKKVYSELAGKQKTNTGG